MRLSLRGRLLVTYLVPTTLALALVAGFAWWIARASLEASLGNRLTSAAEAVAVEMRPEDLGFLRPGDETTRTYRRIQRQLETIRKATGLRRIFVFDPKGRAIVDSGGAYPIGTRIADLARDQLEVGETLAGTATASSVLFAGRHGHLFKSGYAPVKDDSGKVVAAVGVDGSAAFFDTLLAFRRHLILLSLLGLLAIVLVSIVFSRTLTRPIRRLSLAAGRIGEGDLETPVAVPKRNDEVASLARALDEMRSGLLARDRQLQMMLAGIAHEVRNPLGGIELFSGLLAEELPEGDERAPHVARIRKELSHLTRLVESFLDYARDRELERELCEVREMLVEVCELCAPDAEAKGVVLEVAGGGEDVTVEADSSLVRRAVLNLVRNAVQATPGGGRVEVSVAKDGDEIAIAVDDTGPGIPDAERERIFEPFYTTREKGSGLGLALVKKAAEAHGGRALALASASGGARFELRLPA